MRDGISSIAKSCALLCAATAIASSIASAEDVPLCGPVCFHSSDPTVVDVRMVHQQQHDRQLDLKIPRSAIVYVSGYDARFYKALPKQVEVWGPWLNFAVVAPTGRPFGEAVQELAEREHISLAVAATRMRAQYALVRIDVIGRDIPNGRLYSAWLPEQASDASVRATEPFDGLPGQMASYQVRQVDGTTSEVDGPYITYFPVGKEDPFVLIRCEINPHPVTWCVYQARPNDLVRLEVKMSDFRVYGGRHFVQERLKMILDAYCDYDLSCRP